MSEPRDVELDILERGLLPDGVKLGFDSKAERNAFRMKLYRRRDADRKQAAIMADRPIFRGLSPYDVLAMNYFLSKSGQFAMHIVATEQPTILEDE